MSVKTESLKHYDDMMAWVDKQVKPSDKFTWMGLISRMLKDINQLWNGKYCSYCGAHRGEGGCSVCSLHNGKPDEDGYYGSDGCCDGLWSRIGGSKRWTELYEELKNVKNYIEQYGEEEG